MSLALCRHFATRSATHGRPGVSSSPHSAQARRWSSPPQQHPENLGRARRWRGLRRLRGADSGISSSWRAFRLTGIGARSNSTSGASTSGTRYEKHRDGRRVEYEVPERAISAASSTLSLPRKSAQRGVHRLSAKALAPTGTLSRLSARPVEARRPRGELGQFGGRRTPPRCGALVTKVVHAQAALARRETPRAAGAQ